MEILYQSSSTLTLAINIEGIPTNADIIDGVHQVFITITRMADSVVIVDESGVDNESEGHYSYILDPNDNLTLGKYRVLWEYTFNGEVFPKSQFYDVVVPYTNAADFKAEFSEMSSKSDSDIYRKEKLARHIINTFCHQSFDFEVGVTKKVEGADSDRLYLPRRIYNLTSVKINNASDISDQVEIFTDMHLRRKITDTPLPESSNIFSIDFFRENTYYFVVGDWGWEYVPEDIQRASNLLIKDYFEDDSMLRQHGVFQATIGDEQYYFNNDLWNTTGNYDVDILISNFTNFNIRNL